MISQQGAVGLQGPCDYTETQVTPDGHLIGDEADSDWLKVTPWGFRLMLNWVNNRCTQRIPATCILCMSEHLCCMQQKGKKSKCTFYMVTARASCDILPVRRCLHALHCQHMLERVALDQVPSERDRGDRKRHQHEG